MDFVFGTSVMKDNADIGHKMPKCKANEYSRTIMGIGWACLEIIDYREDFKFTVAS